VRLSEIVRTDPITASYVSRAGSVLSIVHRKLSRDNVKGCDVSKPLQVMNGENESSILGFHHIVIHVVFGVFTSFIAISRQTDIIRAGEDVVLRFQHVLCEVSIL
jgi:hypothetical protein